MIHGTAGFKFFSLSTAVRARDTRGTSPQGNVDPSPFPTPFSTWRQAGQCPAATDAQHSLSHTNCGREDSRCARVQACAQGGGDFTDANELQVGALCPLRCGCTKCLRDTGGGEAGGET